MNESFADFTIFNGLDPTADPTPFLHCLTENTVQGWMYSPVTGGGTATVEFEYLTGFSTLFQPPHTVAYQLYVNEDMPSLAALAGSAGYETTAFHPYKSSGWNRLIVYHYLDFDHQMYEEDVDDPRYIRHYISDRSDYEMVMKTTRQSGDVLLLQCDHAEPQRLRPGQEQSGAHHRPARPVPKNGRLPPEQYLALARQTTTP